MTDALLINPTDANRMAEALHEALLMPEEEQISRMSNLQALVKQYDVFAWTRLCMDRLAYSKIKQHILSTDPLDEAAKHDLLVDYQAAQRRLLLLDYDGTLVRFHANPQNAQPDPELLQLLSALAADSRNRVVIISGRDRATLDKWLGHLPLNFIAEHGVWLRRASEEWTLFQELRDDWKPELRSVMELYVRRTAGSSIEEKDYSLVWHYRRVDAQLGAVRARDLLSHLTFITSNTGLQVLEGSKILEVKNAGINKGAAATRWISAEQPDFILALGDDRTDEDTFGVLPPEAYSVKVGSVPHSRARFCVGDLTEVRQILQHLL